MKNKTISKITLLILLIGSAVLTFNIHIEPVKAWTGTVYIRADGSIDPPDAPIITYDNVTYTLTNNITSSGDGIVVERDNIIIDGAGYTIQGTFLEYFKGISLNGRINVTVRNVQINNFAYGVWISNFSSNNNISGNSITNSDIYVLCSSNNNICGNNINNCGVFVYYSSNYNSIRGNKFTNDGLVVWDSYYNVVENNTVNGKPLVYLEGVVNYSVGDAGQVILVNCDGIRVENLNLSRTRIGVQLWKTKNSVINGNNIKANKGVGVELDYSSSNIISGNNITNNGWGIWLEYSSNNVISRNNITANGSHGIYFYSSSNYNIIGGNNIAANDCGIELARSSNYNIINGNNVTANRWIGIYFFSSSRNAVSGNNITNNDDGIWLTFSSNNRFYHNNFMDNHAQVYNRESTNVWDDGYPSGGNCWSDHTGVDLYSGPYQNETGSDGMGDAPYVIDENNVDNYPLVAPFRAFEAGVWNQRAFFVDVISNSTLSGFLFNPYVYPPYLKFNVTGSDGSFGFCRVTVPKYLLWARDEDWKVLVDGDEVNYTLFRDEHNTYLYFTYSHSTKIVVIEGTQTSTVLYNLTITSTTGGTTDPSPGTYSYMAGTVVNVIALPNKGYSFDYWLLDGEVKTENPITVMMDRNHTLEAFFVDDVPPSTSDDYDGLWHNSNFMITLTAIDYGSGVAETYYRINNGPVKRVSVDGYPLITSESGNNTLEYWSVDNAGNEELHKFLSGIKLDKTSPLVTGHSRFPEDNVEPGQSVKITVNVTDNLSGVKDVILSYRVSGELVWHNITMTLNQTTMLYEATIQMQQLNVNVEYKIIAYDNAENPIVEDNNGLYYKYYVIPEFPSTIVILLAVLIASTAIVLFKKKKRTKTNFSAPDTTLISVNYELIIYESVRVVFS